MSDMLILYDSVTSGIKKWLRNFFLMFLVIVMGIIITVIAFTQGWIKIVLNPNGHNNRFENMREYQLPQSNDESIIENFRRNPWFNLIRHSVEPGETLFDLENRYGTDWKVIRKLNRIENPLDLNPGNTIWVPVKMVDS